MKKKLFLIIAVVIMAIASCFSLISCAPDGGDDSDNDNEKIAASISEYVDLWKKSSAKYYQEVYDTSDWSVLVGVNGMQAVRELDSYKTIYQIVKKDELNVYDYSKEEKTWTRQYYNTFDDIRREFKFDGTELVNANKFIEDTHETLDYVLEMEKELVKNGNIYTGKVGSKYEIYTIKIAAKEMTIDMVSDDDLSKHEATIKFGMGFDTVVIPDEAKQAPDTTNKRIVEKAVDKFVLSANKTINIGENESYSIYENIIKFEDSYKLLYIEKNGSTYNTYYLDKNNQDAVWTAETVTSNEALVDKLYEYCYINIDSFDSFSELFDKLASRSSFYGLQRNYDIDRFFDKIEENKYSGNSKFPFSDYTLTILENKLVLESEENDNEEIAYCTSITIPLDAKDALI